MFYVNDRVFSFEYGWGTVVKVDNINCIVYPVLVKYDRKDEKCYTVNGKSFKDNTHKSLFHEDEELTIPQDYNKFKMNTLVLVKDHTNMKWHIDMYIGFDKNKRKHICNNALWKYCISYNNNKEKLGKVTAN